MTIQAGEFWLADIPFTHGIAPTPQIRLTLQPKPSCKIDNRWIRGDSLAGRNAYRNYFR